MGENGQEAHISSNVKCLASGPYSQGWRYNAAIVNGFRFRTRSHEKNRSTQNSGVICRADTTSYASGKDKNPVANNLAYYGVLTDIIKIRYTNALQFLLFKCDWVDLDRGRKLDEFKFTLVNFNRLLYRENKEIDEPFILANQAEQVWYSRCPIENDWHVAMPMIRRDNFDVYSRHMKVLEAFPTQDLDTRPVVRELESEWVRDGIHGEEVDLNGQRMQAAM